MNWLRYFLISTDTRNMAYRRNRTHDTLILIGLLVIALIAIRLLS